MSPAAVYTTGVTTQYQPLATKAIGSTLVIGSPSTARDGQYQALITELENDAGTVEKQMLDRLVDAGAQTDSVAFITKYR